MIEISFLAGEVFFAVIWFAVRAVLCIKRKKISIRQELLMLLMYINLAVILRYIFYPYEKAADGSIQPLLFCPDEMFPPRVNLVPLVHIAEFDSTHDLLLNILGNVGMFVPSGIVMPVLYKRLDTFLKVTAAGALLSLTIEIIQLPFSVRASDIDDIILNTAGCMIGYGIYALFRGIGRAVRRTADGSAVQTTIRKKR